MIKNKSLVMTAMLLAIVACFSCMHLKGSQPAPVSEIAALVPDGSLALLNLRSLDDVLNSSGGGIGGLLSQVAELTGGKEFDPKEMEEKILKTLGFDPLSPNSYIEGGIATNRPLAVALPSLPYRKKLELLVMVPVNDGEKFKHFLFNTMKVISGENFRDVGIDTGADGIGYFIDTSLGRKILYFKVKDGYFYIARGYWTLQWALASRPESSLASDSKFLRTFAGAPKNPIYYLYLSPELLEILRFGMETASRSDAGDLRQWLSGSQGALIAGETRNDLRTTFVSLPAPLDTHFREAFKGHFDASEILKKMPANPATIITTPLDSSHFVGAIMEAEHFMGGNRNFITNYMPDTDREEIFRILSEGMGNGLMYVSYPPPAPDPGKTEETEESGKFLLVAPIKDKAKMEPFLKKVVERIGEEKDIDFVEFGSGEDALYATDYDLRFLLKTGKKKTFDAETYLSAIGTAEISFFAENNVYGGNFDAIGWAPMGPSQYTIYLSCYNCKKDYDYDSPAVEGWTGDDCSVKIDSRSGAPKTCPEEVKKWLATPCDGSVEYTDHSCFRAAAVANLDSDPTLDVWTIDGRKQPMHIVNDLDGKLRGGPKSLLGIHGSNLIITNDSGFIKNLDSGGAEPSAYSVASDPLQTGKPTAPNPDKPVVIVALGELMNGLFPKGFTKRRGALPPIGADAYEKFFPANFAEVYTFSIEDGRISMLREARKTPVSLPAVIAISALQSFVQFQSKARQSEAKTNLASIVTAEISYFAEKNNWGGNFETIGWSPQGETKYSYYISCHNCSVYHERNEAGETETVVKGWSGNSCEIIIPSSKTGYSECPDALKEYLNRPCEDGYESCFRAGAVGNIDGDSTLDIWGIDQQKSPENLVSDVDH